VLVLYATRELSIEPAILGLIFGAGGLGGLLRAVLAGQAARRFGLGPALAGAACLGVTSNLLIPLAGQSPPMAVPMLMAAQFIGPGAGTAYNIIGVTLRQAITPNRLQGRMNATIRFLVWGTMPIDALVGGALGEAIGLRPTLFVAALGMLLAPLWVLFSPLRTLRDPPSPPNLESA
jgi:predicted MFS family arabinose efflux permease